MAHKKGLEWTCLVAGAGWALVFASVNSYAVTLPRANEKLGLLHAAYGVGSLIVPLASTPFSAHIRFFYFYAISLCLTVLNALGLFLAFRRKDGELADKQQKTSEDKDEEEKATIDASQIGYSLPQVWLYSAIYFIFVVRPLSRFEDKAD